VYYFHYAQNGNTPNLASEMPVKAERGLHGANKCVVLISLAQC
jgi:hypothetical protein